MTPKWLKYAIVFTVREIERINQRHTIGIRAIKRRGRLLALLHDLKVSLKEHKAVK